MLGHVCGDIFLRRPLIGIQKSFQFQLLQAKGQKGVKIFLQNICFSTKKKINDADKIIWFPYIQKVKMSVDFTFQSKKICGKSA